MMKFLYLCVFIGVMGFADAIAPIGDKPMWRSVADGVSDIPALMEAHKQSRMAAVGARTQGGSIGLKPLFGGKGYLETGLPRGPVLDRIEKQIAEGERQLRGYSPPKFDVRGPAFTIPKFGQNIPTPMKMSPQMPRKHCVGLNGRQACY